MKFIRVKSHENSSRFLSEIGACCIYHYTSNTVYKEGEVDLTNSERLEPILNQSAGVKI